MPPTGHLTTRRILCTLTADNWPQLNDHDAAALCPATAANDGGAGQNE
jgi:hypothetical protein